MCCNIATGVTHCSSACRALQHALCNNTRSCAAFVCSEISAWCTDLWTHSWFAHACVVSTMCCALMCSCICVHCINVWWVLRLNAMCNWLTPSKCWHVVINASIVVAVCGVQPSAMYLGDRVTKIALCASATTRQQVWADFEVLPEAKLHRFFNDIHHRFVVLPLKCRGGLLSDDF